MPKIGARRNAKFLKPGASREETGMMARSGGVRYTGQMRTVVRHKMPSFTTDVLNLSPNTRFIKGKVK